MSDQGGVDVTVTMAVGLVPIECSDNFILIGRISVLESLGLGLTVKAGIELNNS